MTREHITVGLDDTEASWTALRWAAARAAEHAGTVPAAEHAATVPAAEHAATVPAAEDATTVPAAEDATTVRVVHILDESEPDAALAKRRLDDAAALVRSIAPDAEIDLRLRHGSVAPTLVDVAAGDDVLVIGAHRRRIVQSALNGSLPERVATRSMIPVVVVPDDWSPNDGPIVVGVAAGERSEAALEFAAVEAGRAGRRLEILAAWRLPVPMSARPVTVAEDPRLFREGAERSLDAAARRAHALAAELDVHRILVEGGAADGLAKLAEDAALVVVGRHHRTTAGGAVFGSTARGLLHKTRTPVCVVPMAVRVPARDER